MSKIEYFATYGKDSFPEDRFDYYNSAAYLAARSNIDKEMPEPDLY